MMVSGRKTPNKGRVTNFLGKVPLVGESANVERAFKEVGGRVHVEDEDVGNCTEWGDERMCTRDERKKNK